MLEQVVADLLTKVLGDFVEGLRGDSLSIGVWAGRTRFTNLQVKSSAVESLDIPFELAGGLLGALEVIIPWRSLFSQPTVLRLSDLHLLLRPRRRENSYDADTAAEDDQRQKQKRLAKLEALKEEKRRALASPSEEDQVAVGGDRSEPLSSRLLTRLLENLEIFIDDVHIRLEDSSNQYAAGFTLKAAGLCTQEGLLDSHFIHKLLTMNEMGLYWNDRMFDSLPLPSVDGPEAFKDNMRKLIHNPNLLGALHYIIKPLSFSSVIQINRSRPGETIPGQVVSVLVETLQVHLSESQLGQIMQLNDQIAIFRLRKKYRVYRPLLHTPATDPIRFWKFLIEAKLRPIQQHRRLFKGDWLVRRRRNRLEYILLWKSKMRHPQQPLSARLKQLERELSFDDISLFRIQAESQLPPNILPGYSGAVTSGWWGWGASFFSSSMTTETADIQAKVVEESSKLSQSERESFFESIGYVEAEIDSPLKVGSFLGRFEVLT